jgi:hypothetical protein
MKIIPQFLKSQINTFSENDEKIDIKEKDIEKLSSLFLNRSLEFHQTKQLKIKPPVQKGQIWTIKNEYTDFLGFKQNTSHPFIVIVNSEIDFIENECSVRVFIISPFIEMASISDEMCSDPSIIGFPFLIETWNDQPILTDMFNEYLGYYDLKSTQELSTDTLELVNEPISEYSNKRSEPLSEMQREFKNIEISRAKYINHSVLALISFLEKKIEITDDSTKIIPPNNRGKIIKMFVRFTSVAAILIIIVSIWIDKNQNKEFLLSDFDKKDSYELIAKLEPTEDAEYYQNNSRGLEENYQLFTQFETQIIKKGKIKAIQGNYQEAIRDLEKIKNIEKSSELSLLLSLIYIKSGDYKKSIDILKNVNSNLKNKKIKNAILYYLSISYLLNDEQEKAKKTLDKLNKSESNYYKSNVKKLMETL